MPPTGHQPPSIKHFSCFVCGKLTRTFKTLVADEDTDFTCANDECRAFLAANGENVELQKIITEARKLFDADSLTKKLDDYRNTVITTCEAAKALTQKILKQKFNTTRKDVVEGLTAVVPTLQSHDSGDISAREERLGAALRAQATGATPARRSARTPRPVSKYMCLFILLYRCF